MEIISSGTFCAFHRTRTHVTLIWAEVARHFYCIWEGFDFTLINTHHSIMKEISGVAGGAIYFEFICTLQALWITR